MISSTAVMHVMPRANEHWVSWLLDAMKKYEIDSTPRAAYFLATVAEESEELRRFEESLFYSAKRLTQVWPKRFPTIEYARAYEFRPEKIANYVYANRMGNGPAQSGDGFMYRGRGPIMITGRSMYGRAAIAIRQPLIERPDLVLKPEIGCMVAGWVWRDAGCNALADEGNFEAATRKINGGLIGWRERLEYLKRALEVLGD